MKVREEFRNIFFEMGWVCSTGIVSCTDGLAPLAVTRQGSICQLIVCLVSFLSSNIQPPSPHLTSFTEMPTNQFVESSFWNFDTLFVPQQHPARDMQDTFFIKDPVQATDFPREYLEKVRGVHEGTAEEFGSIGYRYPWKESETSKLVLRTHTTSVSAAMLYKIANQPGGFKPSKLFSIDRVFRNETVDATHLAEFHQVEGVVADENITLGDLIGFMEVFFKKMGIENLRFKVG